MARKQSSVELPQGQIVEVNKVFIRTGEYKDNSMIYMSRNEAGVGTRFGTSMQFGVSKAKMLLDAMPALRKFVEDNS